MKKISADCGRFRRPVDADMPVGWQN